MSLAWKLILSHLAVIAVTLLLLASLTAFVAPADFSLHMNQMQGTLANGMQSMMNTTLQAYNDDISITFRQSLNNALLIAGIVATLVGLGLSWYISRRIVQPISKIVAASQFIAEGHYSERLITDQQDEIGELTHSFNRMAAALAEIETMRQQLIADVSHELKTPLASISGYMEGLQDGLIPATPETFQLIAQESGRLQRLVNDLQALSRAEAAQIQMDFRSCSAIDLVYMAVAALQPQFDDKGIDLKTNLPDDSPLIRVDKDRIRQVLVNLLGNALQYTPPGGQVTIRLRAEGKVVHFSVKDSGIGLNKADMERVFLRFYRVDKSRARLSGGSGIGLTIARHIVEAHQGRLWAESAGENEGSTFHFTLPLS